MIKIDTKQLNSEYRVLVASNETRRIMNLDKSELDKTISIDIRSNGIFGIDNPEDLRKLCREVNKLYSLATTIVIADSSIGNKFKGTFDGIGSAEVVIQLHANGDTGCIVSRITIEDEKPCDGSEEPVSRELSFKSLREAVIDFYYNIEMLYRIKYGWGSRTITRNNIANKEIKGCFSCGSEFSENDVKVAMRSCSCPKCQANFLMNRYTWKKPGDTDWINASFMTIRECHVDAMDNGMEWFENFDRGQYFREYITPCTKDVIEDARTDVDYADIDLSFMDSDDVDVLSSLVDRELSKKFYGMSKYSIDTIYEKELLNYA